MADAADLKNQMNQYRRLFSDADYELTRVIPTRAGISIIGGVPDPRASHRGA